LDKGILLIGNLDAPLEPSAPAQPFRRDPDWLYGEGIAGSRAPLVMMQFALQALRSARRLRRLPLAVLYYTDEGRDCRYSQEIIKAAAARAGQILVLRPGNPDNRVITARRGRRKYRLVVEGPPRRLGRIHKRRGVLRWSTAKLDEIARLSSRQERLAVDVAELSTTSFTHLLPHKVTATILVSFVDAAQADPVEKHIREILAGSDYSWGLELISERPPMRKRKRNERLLGALREVAEAWEIPFAHESSLFPSAAGLVPASKGVLCGVGPIGFDVDTPSEAIQRISMLQRTLLLAQFLAKQAE
jgi:D-alanine-D-alanine ligase